MDVFMDRRKLVFTRKDYLKKVHVYCTETTLPSISMPRNSSLGVKFGQRDWKSIHHFHIYTMGSDLERNARMQADLLSGKYGKMDQENPLQMIWIPGRKGSVEQDFPSL